MKYTKQKELTVIVVNPISKEDAKKRIKEISENINKLFSSMEGWNEKNNKQK